MTSSKVSPGLFPFYCLSLGVKFAYEGTDRVFIKIGDNLVAAWDDKHICDEWIGQGVFSFGDDLSVGVHLVDQPVDQLPLNDRLKERGMMTVEEMLTKSPLDAFRKHAGVNSLETFHQWLLMRRKEYISMQSRFTLDKRETDEMYEWVLAHNAVFGEVEINFRAALKAASDIKASEQGIHDLSAACSAVEKERDALLHRANIFEEKLRAIYPHFAAPPGFGHLYAEVDALLAGQLVKNVADERISDEMNAAGLAADRDFHRSPADRIDAIYKAMRDALKKAVERKSEI